MTNKQDEAVKTSSVPTPEQWEAIKEIVTAYVKDICENNPLPF